MISLVLAAALAGSHLGPEQGLWRTADGSAHVEIAPCVGNLCGTIRRLRDPAVRDVHSPNPVARSRLLVGTMVIQGVARDGGGWSGGRLYVPRTGRSYRPGCAWKDGIWSSKGAASASAEESAGHVFR